MFGTTFNVESSLKFRAKLLRISILGLESLGQSNNKTRMATSADLLRRGATLLMEACPKCGGVQVKYQGKIYCLNEDNLDEVLSGRPGVQSAIKKEDKKQVTASEGSDSLRKLLEEKLASTSKQLESTTDVEEQSKLLDLITKYLETLQKLNKTVQ